MDKNISKFEDTLSQFTTTVDQTTNELIKSGILFYESDKNQAHKDSKGRTHYITKEIIQEIVNNTNNLLDEVDIPIVKEHNKVIDDQVGLIADKLEARIVTLDDVRDRPKLQKLIGKTAIFCNAAKILDKTLIDKANSGIPLRVSIGLDVPNKVIRELSVVTIPALNMATLFSKKDNESNFGALTLAEQITQRKSYELDKEEAKLLFDDLLEVIQNIQNADETMLQGADPNELLLNAVDEFEDELALLLGLGQMEDESEQAQQQYRNDVVLDAFSMSEMENLILDEFMFGKKKKSFMDNVGDLKNLGYSKKKGLTYKGRAAVVGKGLKAKTKANIRNVKGSFSKYNDNAEFFGNINLNLGRKKEKKSGLLGNVAKAAVGVGALAAGARYGGANLLKNSGAARGLAQKGLRKIQKGASNVAASSNNSMLKNTASKVANVAAGGRKSLQQYRTKGGVAGIGPKMKQGSGALDTLKSDASRIGKAATGGFNSLRNKFKKKKDTLQLINK